VEPEVEPGTNLPYVRDAHCSELFNNIEGNRYVNNEMYNCTDGIQFYQGGTGNSNIANWDIKEIIIYNNDFYVTPEFLNACPETKSASGGWIENAIDIKMTSDETTPTANRTLIKNNRISGYPGPAIVWHYDFSRGIDVHDNIIFTSNGGVAILKATGTITLLPIIYFTTLNMTHIYHGLAVQLTG